MGPQRSGNSSNSASKSIRQTAAERRPLRPVASAGSVDDVPTPAATQPRGGAFSSPPTAAGISPGRSSFAAGGGEESAFSALEPLVSFIFSNRGTFRDCFDNEYKLNRKWIWYILLLNGVKLGKVLLAVALFPSSFYRNSISLKNSRISLSLPHKA